jgi:hypothetical protein
MGLLRVGAEKQRNTNGSHGMLTFIPWLPCFSVCSVVSYFLDALFS